MFSIGKKPWEKTKKDEGILRHILVRDIVTGTLQNQVYDVVVTQEEFYVMLRANGELLKNLTLLEASRIIESEMTGYKMLHAPITFMQTTYPFDTKKQQEYWEYKRQHVTSPEQLQNFDEKIEELKLLNLALVQVYYFKIYGESIDKAINNAYIFEEIFAHLELSQFSRDEMIELLRNEHNPAEAKNLYERSKIYE